MKVRNLQKAALRIKKAINQSENIILFSDADLDGVACLIILEETIKSLGGKVVLSYFPNRETQGYGLSETALKELEPFAPGILILSDSGITTFKEIKQAKKMGFFVIVVDHHEVLNDKLPSANIIIDPKQAKDPYPFKLMAACGLCFKLSQELLVDAPAQTKQIEQSFLELAALGSIADMVPNESDNKDIIKAGLYSLTKSQRPGLEVLIEIFEGKELSNRELASKLISVLQLTDFEKHHTESYLLLTAEDKVKAKELAELLIQKNIARRDLIKEITREIEQEVIEANAVIIFKGSKQLPHLLTGNIASKLCNKFKKPTFIYTEKKEISRGSVRTPKGVNGVQALNACRDFLDVYGGHPQAAGFTVKNKNLEKLKKCLIKQCLGQT